jgi:hypothetical protein
VTDCHSLILFSLDDTELVIVEDNEYYFNIPHGETNFQINCIPTNPNVNVSLVYEEQYTARSKNMPEPKVRTFLKVVRQSNKFR